MTAPFTAPSPIPIGTINQNGCIWDGVTWRCPTGIPEAPADGRIYGREDGTWQLAIAASGGEIASLTVDGTLTTNSLDILDGGLTLSGPLAVGGALAVNGTMLVIGEFTSQGETHVEGLLHCDSNVDIDIGTPDTTSLVVWNRYGGGSIEARYLGSGTDYCIQVYTELSGLMEAFFYGGGTNPQPEAFIGSITGSETGVAYNTTSDARLKDNDEPFDAGPIIDALEPRRYSWRDRKSVTTHGLFAQDVYEVFPEAVAKPHGDAPWMMDYSKLVPLLVAEVKALRLRVKQLEQ